MHIQSRKQRWMRWLGMGLFFMAASCNRFPPGERGKTSSEQTESTQPKSETHVFASRTAEPVQTFDHLNGFRSIAADGVSLVLTGTVGRAEGKALCMCVDFQGHSGYAVASWDETINLPEDYEFTFYIKGTLPLNTLEFKLLDEHGNVYWKKFPDLKITGDWRKLTARKSQIHFAFGPGGGAGELQKVAKIEFAVSTGNGGSGGLLIADLCITDLAKGRTKYVMKATASSSEKKELDVSNAVDGDRNTRWASRFNDEEWIQLDLGTAKEFVGLNVFWEGAYAKEYDVSISGDGKTWEQVCDVQGSDGGLDALYFGRKRARYIRLNTHKRATSWGNSILEITPRGLEDEVGIIVSSGAEHAVYLMDGLSDTAWQNENEDSTWIILAFGEPRELDGLDLSWTDHYARDYRVLLSNDGEQWQQVFETQRGNGGRDRIFLRGLEARYVKIDCRTAESLDTYGIREIAVRGYDSPTAWNDVYRSFAQEAPRGYYPKYFLDEATYWTLVGVSGDEKEALVNEEGAFETECEHFMVEPFLFVDGKLITWADADITPGLLKDYLPMPIIKWRNLPVEMDAQFFADGDPGESLLFARYTISNPSKEQKKGKLYLAIRPFQVSPPWQKLNMQGGVAPIYSMAYDGRIVRVNDDKQVIPLDAPDGFGLSTYNEGDIVECLEAGRLPEKQDAADSAGFISGALEYSFDLPPGGECTFSIAEPFHQVVPDIPANSPNDSVEETLALRMADRIAFWESRLSQVRFLVPKSKKKFIDVLKSNMAYILINRDGVLIQPGSRSYLRSWIRDGAMTSSAILRLGNNEEVREYLDYYSGFILPYDRIPCVVDHRGADGVPENDSNGEYIYACLQYYYFSRDKAFLQKHYSTIKRAADFIIAMRNERKTPQYRDGPDTERVKYGLVPESISHEGYSERPMHAYWDNFFSLKGLKDAARIAAIVGDKEHAEKYRREVADYRKDLYASIRLAMKNKNIPFIPGCAELGDYDASSTAIAVFPCGELKYLPQEALNKTFDMYYDGFMARMRGEWEWKDMTPYEVRNCQTFVIMEKRECVENMFDFLFSLQRPSGWNHWSEIVFSDPVPGRWIGDMPHTWIGSGYMNAVRSMFVYEREEDGSLVLMAGIPESWMNSGEAVGIEHAPTYYGDVSYVAKQSGDKLEMKIQGNSNPPGGIVIKPPRKAIRAVYVNGQSWNDFTQDEVRIPPKQLPVHIQIQY